MELYYNENMKKLDIRNRTWILIMAFFAIAFGVSLGIFSTIAFSGPSSQPGVGSGAVSADASRNIAIGTSTTQSNIKLLVVGSTTDSSAYGLQVANSAGVSLFSVRNDGTVSIPGAVSIPNLNASGTFTGAFTGTVSAGNVSSGQLGSNTGGGNYSFPASVGIGTSTPAYPLDVAGRIRSSSGGFVFPDGTTQTTAGTNSHIQIFQGNHNGVNENYTWTPPYGVSMVYVTLCGGGGGGGVNSYPGGGGGGGECYSMIPMSVSGNVAVVVGANGTGGLSGYWAATAGGSSSFGSLVAVGGGRGGNGAGGIGSGGAGGGKNGGAGGYNAAGGNGAITGGYGGGGGGSNAHIGGYGDNYQYGAGQHFVTSELGGGGSGGYANGDDACGDGYNGVWGGGGNGGAYASAASCGGSPNNGSGGDGGNGVVIIEW